MSQSISYDPRHVAQHESQQQQDEGDLTNATPAEKFLNIIIYLLAGTALIIGMVLVVFLITKLYDKLCGYWSPSYVLSPEELHERQHATSVTKQAGLAGILPDEKNRALRRFFTERSTKYVLSEEEKLKRRAAAATAAKRKAEEDEEQICATSEDVESQHRPPSPSADTTDPGTERTTNGACAGVDSEAKGECGLSPTPEEQHDDELENLCMMEHEEGTCPICLQEYSDGDFVITGSSCDHRFHLECAMQWLEKGNDHCAYCRKTMIKPDELLMAAREELGDSRVDKILSINELAAQRLEAYRVSMAQATNNAVTSHQPSTSGSLSIPPNNDTTNAVSEEMSSPTIQSPAASDVA